MKIASILTEGRRLRECSSEPIGSVKKRRSRALSFLLCNFLTHIFLRSAAGQPEGVLHCQNEDGGSVTGSS